MSTNNNNIVLAGGVKKRGRKSGIKEQYKRHVEECKRKAREEGLPEPTRMEIDSKVENGPLRKYVEDRLKRETRYLEASLAQQQPRALPGLYNSYPPGYSSSEPQHQPGAGPSHRVDDAIPGPSTPTTREMEDTPGDNGGASQVIDETEHLIQQLGKLVETLSTESDAAENAEPSASVAEEPEWRRSWNQNLIQMTSVLQSKDQAKIDDLRRMFSPTIDNHPTEQSSNEMDTSEPLAPTPTAPVEPTERPTQGRYPPAEYNPEVDDDNFPRPKSKKNKKKKKYNPRRQWTDDDYFSAVDPATPSTSSGQTRREIHIDTEAENQRAKRRRELTKNPRKLSSLMKQLEKTTRQNQTSTKENTEPPRKLEEKTTPPPQTIVKPVAAVIPQTRTPPAPNPQNRQGAPLNELQRQPEVIDLANEPENNNENVIDLT